MVNQQLLDYVKQQLQQGVSREQIKNSLMTNGWHENDIDEAFAIISNNTVPSPQPSIPQQNLTAILPGAMAIFGQAWSVYKKRFWTFLGISIIPFLISVVGGIFFGITTIFAKYMPGQIILFVLIILFFIAIFISFVWGNMALLYAVKDNQEKIGIKEAYKRSRHKILSMCWVGILFGVITLGGFVLLVVPGIIFAVWFSFALFVLIAEDLKGMDALLKSREYVRGKWGSVFWRLFFINILYFIVSWAISLAFYFLKVPFGTQISKFINALLLVPFLLTYLFLLYGNLKTTKGEIIFAPSKGKKVGFIFIGILGLLFPMLLAIGLLSLNTARVIARDAKRGIDVILLQSGLELYANDHKVYPETLSGLQKLYNRNPYMASIPIAPTPADGTCTQEQNNYSYKLIDPTDYEITYCLGRGGQSKNILTGQIINANPGVQIVHGTYH